MQQYRKNLGKVSLTAEGVWDIESKYNVLSIVYDEHTQHGFISKQPVPIGVDLYNSEYWMPLNVSGYTDSNIIILNKKTSDASIESYTLEEAVKSIASVGRKPGCILGFYNSNVNRLDIGGRWEIWQFNSTTISEWEDLTNWQNIYYNYNQFVGWYRNEEQLKINNPYPEVGCYAYIGNIFLEASLYRCEIKHQWKNTMQPIWEYIKIIIDGKVKVGENGNWFNDGVDTGIPARGPKGDTPIIKNRNNKTIDISFDGEHWETLFTLRDITPRINISPNIVLDSTQAPSVRNIGDDFNVNLEFSLPKAADIHIGSVNTLAYNGKASVVNVGSEFHAILNFDIPQGVPGSKGDKGDGWTADGFVSEVSLLPSDVSIGDTYFVGTTQPYQIYIYKGDGWINVGTVNEIKAGVFDGGRADSNYGGARSIDCGRADI